MKSQTQSLPTHSVTISMTSVILLFLCPCIHNKIGVADASTKKAPGCGAIGGAEEREGEGIGGGETAGGM